MSDELAFRLKSKKSFEEVAEALQEKSVENQFRVLAVHDVQATLAEKGFERGPLKIIEVCNSGFAYEALKKDIDASMFMPCKFTVYRQDDATVVTLALPTMISKMLPDSNLDSLAEEVEERLKKIMQEIV
ncbi:MAG: DUF302 domain-containing protein [candidate division Zixibacteria bacterium]|nr:DUF302 domain-containing protein [candidate division Zixibacteria bacterium]